MESEVQSIVVPVEVAPRLADGVGVEDVFIAWIKRAQTAPLMKPRGDAYVNVRVPLTELQAVLGSIDGNGAYEAAIARAGGINPNAIPQPLKRPRRPRADASA